MAKCSTCGKDIGDAGTSKGQDKIRGHMRLHEMKLIDNKGNIDKLRNR